MAELVQGLRAHVDDHAAALAACQAMARLIGGEQAEKAAAIARAGGIETVLAAGAKHAGSAQVAEQVCRVLLSLAYYTDDNKAAIAAAGGLKAVVRVMIRTPDFFTAAIKDKRSAASFPVCDKLAPPSS